MGIIRSALKLRHIAIAALLGGTTANAGIRVEPMAYDLTTSGSGASQDLRVQNTSDRAAPVELRVERREILEDGTDKRTPADDDFMIFPPQGAIPPNGFQNFRVQYVGPPLAKTVLYAITVAELPVNLAGDEQSGVRFIFNLGTLAAVSPRGAKPAFVINQVTPSPEPQSLRIKISNEGNGYARLRTGRWTITNAKGQTETLEGETLQKAIGQPLIEPGTSRVIDLPVSAAFALENAKVNYELLKHAAP